MAKNINDNPLNEDKLFSIAGYIAILVILVAIISLGMRLTGYATTDTAIVNVTIDTTASIVFITDLIEFGRGNVIGTNTSATLYSNNTPVEGGNWSAIDTHFELQNNGNKNVSLQLKGGKTAQQLLSGASPSYQYMVRDKTGEEGSCTDGAISLDTFYDVNVTDSGTVICGNLSATDTMDEIWIDVKLVIPSDSLSGNQFDTFTATGTANG